MVSWFGRKGQKDVKIYSSIGEGLRNLYQEKLYPLEVSYKFHDFHSPPLNDSDFDAKPLVLLVGQYSTGKTTFIRYLLGQDFPGMRIGPEPTTDCFSAIMHGDQNVIIPGHVLTADANKPFRPLSKFGNTFLNRFQGCQMSSQLLENVTFVDTPGILSGEKQRVTRGYDFPGVITWLAERADRIVLLFDSHKLDISDEFRTVIQCIKPYDEKIRIILNKADIDQHQLVRVHGALMWSLGKILSSPEVPKVYVGSFWSNPLQNPVNRELFEKEEQDFFNDIATLQRDSTMRKVNDLVKRARLVRAHAYIISELKNQSGHQRWFSSDITKNDRKKDLIQRLNQIYQKVQYEHRGTISPGDFPELSEMQLILRNHDFTKFNGLKSKQLEDVNKLLEEDLSKLVALIPEEQKSSAIPATFQYRSNL